MLIAVMLVLTAGPFAPTWNPTVPVPQSIRSSFDDWIKVTREDLRPTSTADANCFWAHYLVLESYAVLHPDAKAIQAQAARYLSENCGDWPGGRNGGLFESYAFHMGKRLGAIPQAKVQAETAPFTLPPLPDRGGGDLGQIIWAMFQTMESRLSSGGIHLEGEGRACAWASGAFAAADATVRAELGTPGIASAVPVLQKQVGTYCRGQALAQKDAAWAWLREHRATQPLVVAARPATSPWPAPRPGDVAAWLTAALLVYAPEAWPILVAP